MLHFRFLQVPSGVTLTNQLTQLYVVVYSLHLAKVVSSKFHKSVVVQFYISLRIHATIAIYATQN